MSYLTENLFEGELTFVNDTTENSMLSSQERFLFSRYLRKFISAFSSSVYVVSLHIRLQATLTVLFK